MPAHLRDRHVVVVGGGSGIGHAVAHACLELGAEVTIASTSADRVAAAAARLGHRARPATVDVTDEDDVRRFFDGLAPVDHLVTTAGDWGGQRSQTLADLDLEAGRAMFDVRFWGALALAKHGADRITADGSITLTNGMIGANPRKGSLVSTAVAGSIEHVARALSIEVSPVRVNVVCPGVTSTGGWETLAPEDREARRGAIARTHLIPRPAEPDEVVQAYLYLMLGGYTTGQVIRVEGGSTLGG
ncbi:SDR family oxidoreductase [Aeromicrobium sp. Leaf350]|uniref:SDR family oxidoreductase n=1 Tax=Aeromicrobium sp. Leaf350 TaxID=2876565 RepID=UPI001E5C4C82|nr:SDR family oxidoreductase [Aeromicrobium sp. Leaf350]